MAFLYTQSAEYATFADGELLLEGVSPKLVFFSDRPERIGGQVSVEDFLTLWDEGPDSFADDPPNADLFCVVDGESRNAVVELQDPLYSEDDATLSYAVIEISGEVPAECADPSLFLDMSGKCKLLCLGGIFDPGSLAACIAKC